MNRGSPHVEAIDADVCSRFNEAPIHESGKSRRAEREPGAILQCRFNEAPIHESGKSRAAPIRNGASMRRFRIGEVDTQSGFNEAPIHESGKSRSDIAEDDPSQCRFNEAPIHESGKFWQ